MPRHCGYSYTFSRVQSISAADRSSTVLGAIVKTRWEIYIMDRRQPWLGGKQS